MATAADRKLVPVAVSNVLGLPLKDLISWMRDAGMTEQLIVPTAKRWKSHPDKAPMWVQNRTVSTPRTSRSQIDKLTARDGPACHWCRQVVVSRLRTRDHLVPRCAGGSGGLDNLVLACLRCNTTRGHVPADVWGAAMVCALAGPLGGRHPAVVAFEIVHGPRVPLSVEVDPEWVPEIF